MLSQDQSQGMKQAGHGQKCEAEPAKAQSKTHKAKSPPNQVPDAPAELYLTPQVSCCDER